jgi:glutamate N-acetyltransferase / amino-acid N-acetyltransferase
MVRRRFLVSQFLRLSVSFVMKTPKHTYRVPGFRFAGISAGIKQNRQPDLALIVSDIPAKAVATFTTNRLQAAPVLQGKRVIKGARLQAVVINSGNANAATGPRGLRDSLQTAAAVARLLRVPAGSVLVSSTGKIGIPLPVKKIVKALPKVAARLSPSGLTEAARAIMTTDAFPKYHQVKGELFGKPFTIAGFAKGAGMIEPNMATMLAYVVTDLDFHVPSLKRLFSKIVESTFNSITVDGDTSTNDTALLLANGMSGIPALQPGSPGWRKVEALLYELCASLAWMMVKDGEGGTKAVEIHVLGAKNSKSAKNIAFTVARSQLVKTSFFGEDPNWGRVFAAVGYSGESFDPKKVDIHYGEVPLVRKGLPTPSHHEKQAHRLMKNPTFKVTVHLNQGKGEAKVWTSDLTYDYVKINAEYRT